MALFSFFIRTFSVVILLSLIPSSNSFLKSRFYGTTQITSQRSILLDKSLLVRQQHVVYGIPKLFRWLVDLYPIVLESVNDGFQTDSMRVDNFYLDMNGIIHTCTHSNNDKLIVLNEREMFQRIFAYTDRLYKLVKPGRLMFLAVDGVAPRAKMNQQRSRRFRAAKEQEALLADYVAREGKLPDEVSFDSNCITPGTEFMFRLGIAFRRWIAYKMETDPFWQTGAEVVFSGPDVPGEGEHKVMDMIRKEQNEVEAFREGKMRNCMYGLDADLIMLTLVSHEPHFVLLREKIKARQGNKDVMKFTTEDFELLEISILRKMLTQHFSKLKGKIEHLQRVGSDAALPADSSSSSSGSSSDGSAEPVNVSESVTETDTTTSSEATRVQMTRGWSNAGFDIDRIIDDFVFMCFFVGNDFLPCLPHMDIADGSLNLMMNVYRDMLPEMGGYLTDKSKIHLPRLELFIQEISRREPLYFQQRSIDERDQGYADDGYKAHYYKTKLNIDINDEAAVRSVVKSHLEGLAWVLSYYHQGCSSWTWYFPELYAPLGTDFKNLASINLEFDRGVPFTPLLQLLSVLPPQSGSFLPKSYEATMTSPDSPLAPYYPKDFEVDANGKKNAWECIVRIPFINSTLLVDEISKINHKESLTEVERLRNILGEEHRFPPPGRKAKSTATGGNTASTLDGRDLVNEKFEQDSLSFNRGGSGGWGNALADNRRPSYSSPNPAGNNNPNSNSNSNRSPSSGNTGDRSTKRR